MKVSLKWLRDYVDITMPPVELGKRLTLAGLEPAEIKIIGGWNEVYVALVAAVNPHPNADRLRLATVDLGNQQMTVVCGAPNLKIGDKVAFAKVGAELIDSHSGEKAVLKPAKIRGVVSEGMVCSEKELGISQNHEGLLVLPEDAPLGVSLSEYLGDVIFDLEVTANRVDCLSVLGVAHEVAAQTGKAVQEPQLHYHPSATKTDSQVSVEILAPDLCPRYTAIMITGVKIGPSPKWIQDRLIACGSRPINNIVDVSNYVMLEYGQPLHTFDYDLVRGKKIIVRRARNGEVITTLDGEERKLTEEMVVVADADRAVALAGVMGGANSQVTDRTVNILLESANWHAPTIRKTARDLKMTSDAAYRFERNLSAGLTLPALMRAANLIAELGGGTATAGIIDVYPGKKEAKPIALTTKDVSRILGIGFSLERINSVLTSLGFECKTTSPESIDVSVPYWRSDVTRTVDLIEEVARTIGYDQIPMTLLAQEIPHQNPAPIIGLKQKVRDVLTGFGVQEILTYTLTSMDAQVKLLPQTHTPKPMMHLFNAMSVEQEYFRPNLRANVLTALASNRRFEDGGIRLFEQGRTYIPKKDELPVEPEMLCGVLSGPRQARWWQNTEDALDFYDAKGTVEGLLGLLGVEAEFSKSDDEGLHPAKQASVSVNGRKLGIVGEVHPAVLQAFDITGTAAMFEIDLSVLSPLLIVKKTYQPLPRFPSVTRDIALVLDESVTHKTVMDIIKSFSLVSQAQVFDVFSSDKIGPGKKSMAYRVTYLSTAHTLTDEEVNGVQKQMLDKLAKELGATLRS